MEFDKSKVYTALNADELKLGSKVFVADDLYSLKQVVEDSQHIDILEAVNPDHYGYRFDIGDCNYYMLCYLVSEPNKPRRMTNRELAKWLAQGNGQWHVKGTNAILTSYSYGIDDKELPDNIMIRGWNEDKWHEPVIKEVDK